jgi:hypothetical protein
MCLQQIAIDGVGFVFGLFAFEEAKTAFISVAAALAIVDALIKLKFCGQNSSIWIHAIIILTMMLALVYAWNVKRGDIDITLLRIRQCVRELLPLDPQVPIAAWLGG